MSALQDRQPVEEIGGRQEGEGMALAEEQGGGSDRSPEIQRQEGQQGRWSLRGRPLLELPALRAEEDGGVVANLLPAGAAGADGLRPRGDLPLFLAARLVAAARRAIGGRTGVGWGQARHGAAADE